MTRRSFAPRWTLAWRDRPPTAVPMACSQSQAAESLDPVNYRKRDRGRIEQDVDYAFQILKSFQEQLEKCGLPVAGCNIVELGPGSSIGAQLILASMGARVTLADRYLPKWDPSYHPELYAAIAARRKGPKDQLIAVVEGESHAASNLRLLEEPAEALASVASGSVDFVYSNAVLEHIVDISKVAAENVRILKPLGWAVHQIDLRDHRDFSRPLEHLIMNERSFTVGAEDSYYEFGNRVRAMEFCAHFENAGLRIVECETNETATSEYLLDSLPRLRSSASMYRLWPEQDLCRVSSLFMLQKEEGRAADALRSRGRDAVSMIEALKAASLSAPQSDEPERILSAEVLLSPQRMRRRKGFLWTIGLPSLFAGDSIEQQGSSLELYEDGEPLGPAHSIHEVIALKGRGRYSHWEYKLYFSTSDNSSPVENGRRYTVRVPGTLSAPLSNRLRWASRMFKRLIEKGLTSFHR